MAAIPALGPIIRSSPAADEPPPRPATNPVSPDDVAPRGPRGLCG